MEYLFRNEKVGEDTFNTKRCRLWNSLRFGTYQIAIRKKSFLKYNLSFTQLFGGGSIYSSGEDSLLLVDLFKKKLKVYTYGACIGTVRLGDSCWFKGYNEKFFYDKGAFFSCAFPKVYPVFVLYFVVKFRNKKELSLLQKYNMMMDGAHGYKNLIEYHATQ